MKAPSHCWLASLVVAIAAPVSASASETVTWQQFERQVVAQAHELAASERAEDRYLAARLTTAVAIDASTGDQLPELKHQREQWLQQAFTAPGESLIVARAALGQCKIEAACEKARAHWQALDVADAGAWLMPNAAGEISEAAWAAAAASGRYLSDYELELPALLRASAAWTLPAPPAGMAGLAPDVPVSGRDMLAVVAVATLAATHDLPMKVINQCKTAAAGSLRQRQCRSILEAMADSPTLVQASVGTAIRTQLASDPADQQYWQQRRRELAWLIEKSTPLLNRQPVYDYVLRASREGERATTQALLAEAGIAPVPAADWQPYSTKVAAD